MKKVFSIVLDTASIRKVRHTWNFKPTTKVINSKKLYTRKIKHKNNDNF